MEGRKEKRISQRIPVLLSSLAQPLHAEQASTEDITSYGVRVETGRQWKLGSIVLVKSPQGRPLIRARVVYCKPVEPKAFSLGLEFVTRNPAWMTR